MARSAMAGPKAGILHPAVSCSVCLEVVGDAKERSIAKLICGHQFHLDCIGSAFNAKGYMQCPNCRCTENGQWLYATGSYHQRDDFSFESEEEFDVFAGVSELLFPHDLMFGLLEWCPYQGSYSQLSYSLRDGVQQQFPSAHADLVFDVVVGENIQSSDSMNPCPFVLAQGSNTSRRMLAVEGNAGMHDTPVHSRDRASRPQFLTSTATTGQCALQPSAMVAPVGVVRSVDFEERSRWPQSETQQGRNSYPPHTSRHHGWLVNPAQPYTSQMAAHYPAAQFPRRPIGAQEYAGTSAQSMEGEVELRNNNNVGFTPRTQEGRSVFMQYPTAQEGQRWAPPPLSGLYGAHGILRSGLPMQARFGAPGMQYSNQYDGSFPGFQPYGMAEDGIPHRPSSFEPPR